jgi:hypothetical protein
VCVRGASALQDLLAAHPGATLRAQVVWEPVLPTDLGPPFERVLARAHDPRVRQYWDPQRTLSQDLVRAFNAAPQRYGMDEPLDPDFIAWDLVIVFDPTAQWERDVPPPHYYGGPVEDVVEDARKAIAELLH